MKKKRIVDINQPIDYSTKNVPTSYCCGKCGASGVKLWRLVNTSTLGQTLRCIKCTYVENGKEFKDACWDTKTNAKYDTTNQIGNRVPAIPIRGNSAFWSHGLASDAADNWWKELPLTLDGEENK